MMEYKNYLGDIRFDSDARIFHGEVINTRDVITFEGKSVDELEKAFRDSVQDYLDWCAADGVEPERPYSGRFNLRISPELHKELAIAARMMKTSINRFVEKAVRDELALINRS